AVSPGSHQLVKPSHGRLAFVMPAPSAAAFEAFFNHEVRLRWDTLLQVNYIEGGGTHPYAGAISTNRGRGWKGGVTMRTRFLVYDPRRRKLQPDLHLRDSAASRMVRGFVRMGGKHAVRLADSPQIQRNGGLLASGEPGMTKGVTLVLALLLVATFAAAQSRHDALIARAKALELDTPYVPPPGDP